MVPPGAVNGFVSIVIETDRPLLFELSQKASIPLYCSYGLSTPTARRPVEPTSWHWGIGGWPICFLVFSSDRQAQV
eukprot:SAG22_NODE_2478_length_2529_cov_6.910700_3_plen_76_part_00